MERTYEIFSNNNFDPVLLEHKEFTEGRENQPSMEKYLLRTGTKCNLVEEKKRRG